MAIPGKSNKARETLYLLAFSAFLGSLELSMDANSPELFHYRAYFYDTDDLLTRNSVKLHTLCAH
jgi:hypothetical protein